LHPSFEFIADPLIGSKEIPTPFEESGVAKASRPAKGIDRRTNSRMRDPQAEKI
jgi:hypothetical protein